MLFYSSFKIFQFPSEQIDKWHRYVKRLKYSFLTTTYYRGAIIDSVGYTLACCVLLILHRFCHFNPTTSFIYSHILSIIGVVNLYCSVFLRSRFLIIYAHYDIPNYRRCEPICSDDSHINSFGSITLCCTYN